MEGTRRARVEHISLSLEDGLWRKNSLLDIGSDAHVGSEPLIVIRELENRIVIGWTWNLCVPLLGEDEDALDDIVLVAVKIQLLAVGLVGVHFGLWNYRSCVDIGNLLTKDQGTATSIRCCQWDTANESTDDATNALGVARDDDKLKESRF